MSLIISCMAGFCAEKLIIAGVQGLGMQNNISDTGYIS